MSMSIITIGDIDAYITILQLTQIITTKLDKKNTLCMYVYTYNSKSQTFMLLERTQAANTTPLPSPFLLNQMQDLCQESSQDKQNFGCIFFMYIRLEHKIRYVLHLAYAF